uniref:Uncharacterized protein n=1 Tax=Arundo donax TaxID=35708 RepID=A0A0A9DKW9_ARUDO
MAPYEVERRGSNTGPDWS